jgi:predicted aldo/keto reductase-like oxidoreductase
MREERKRLNRREFVKKGLQVAAGAAALSSGIARANSPKDKKIAVTGSIPTREFGKTGHTLPILGFGGCGIVKRWGAFGYNAPVLPEEERVAMVRYGYDQGIRYFDTARGYYESEEIMGKGLKGVRDDVYLASKIWALKPQDVRKSVETSLETLQTDYVDAMQIHSPLIERLGFEDSMKLHAEMLKLRDEGLFRFIGLTTHVAFEPVHKMISTGGFDQVMLAYGYCKGFHQMLSEKNIEWREKCIAEASDLNMGLVLMKVFNGWVYNRSATRMVPDYDKAALAKLPAAAFRWVLQEERFQIFNVGMSYPSDIDEDIRILNGDLTVTREDSDLLADFTAKVYESSWAKGLKVV